MKKVIALGIGTIIVFSMVASGSFIDRDKVEQSDVIISTSSSLSLKQSITQLRENIESYLTINPERFLSGNQQKQLTELPWKKTLHMDLLEWWVTVEYNGYQDERKVEISISDFQEQFLQHPEHYKSLTFNVDGDPQDDIEVFIGFYWSIIDYPDGQEGRSLESRFRVRQTPSQNPGGGLEDQFGSMRVWSEIRVNYGLIKSPGKSKVSSIQLISALKESLNTAISSAKKIWDQEKVPAQSNLFIFRNLFNRLMKMVEIEAWRDGYKPNGLGLVENSDTDYIAVGIGFDSDSGKKIPLFVEKRFAFSKSFNKKWLGQGNLFNPTIFEHELYDVSSSDPVTLLYGFKAYQGDTNTKMFDVAFTSEFAPPVYLKTKYIPTDSYVYYYFDQKSRRSGQVEVTFSADVAVGQGIDIPELVLTFDSIDDTLARAGRWFSINIDTNIFGRGDLIGFHYKASHEFDVGIKVNVPELFEEKVKLKGIPTRVDVGWDVYVDVTLLPYYVDVTFGGKVELDMQNNLDQITVFYPKADVETDDEAFIDFNNIPMYEKLEAKATLKVRTGAVFEVNPEGLIDMDMSSSPGEISIYYPKAVAEDPNIKFMYIPANSIPSRAEVGGEVGVTIYDIGDGIPDDPRNKIYGNIYHDCNQNIQRVDFYLPSEQATPILQMLDMPADSYAEGALQWGQLQGHVYATRGYLGNRDPIILSLSYAGYDIYNKFEIEEGHFRTGFKIGTDGYVYMDTAKKMFSNNLRVNNNDQDAPLSKLHLTIDQLSVDDLRADWDIDTSGDQLKVNHLSIGGVVDTLSGLHFDLIYQGKNTWLDFDWITGEAGHVRIDFKQDDPIQIDFSMLENLTSGTGITLDGYVELSQNPHFDVEWKWHQGERYIDPGYFRINQYSNTPNIQDMSLSLIWQDLWGAEAHVRNVGIYVCVEWYWYNLLLYIWPVIEISGTVDLDLLLNGQWYDALTYENPP